MPLTLRHTLCTVALAALACAAAAHGTKFGAISIGHPWARATAAGQMAGGGFLTLGNAGAADRLLGASSPAADRVELHSMKLEGDVMRMRQIDALDLPAGQTVELRPGGYHLMFMGLKAPLQAGTRVPLKLRFEKAGEVTVEVQVDAATALPPKDGASHAH